MTLPKIYTIATTVLTKTIKFVTKHAPIIVAGVGAAVGKRIKEKYETMEEYKGWKI